MLLVWSKSQIPLQIYEKRIIFSIFCCYFVSLWILLWFMSPILYQYFVLKSKECTFVYYNVKYTVKNEK